MLPVPTVKMMESQLLTGGSFPEKDVAVRWRREETEEEEEEEEWAVKLKHQSLAFHPLALDKWMFEVDADLTGSNGAAAAPVIATTTDPPHAIFASQESCRMSRSSSLTCFGTPMLASPPSFATSKAAPQPSSFQPPPLVP